MSGSIVEGKRWPASQRCVVLQFDSPEAAARWDAAGQPIWFPFPLSASPEDEQHERDDGEDDEDRPKHVRTIYDRARR